MYTVVVTKIPGPCEDGHSSDIRRLIEERKTDPNLGPTIDACVNLDSISPVSYKSGFMIGIGIGIRVDRPDSAVRLAHIIGDVVSKDSYRLVTCYDKRLKCLDLKTKY